MVPAFHGGGLPIRLRFRSQRPSCFFVVCVRFDLFPIISGLAMDFAAGAVRLIDVDMHASSHDSLQLVYFGWFAPVS
jgi:hypothetical protein